MSRTATVRSLALGAPILLLAACQSAPPSGVMDDLPDASLRHEGVETRLLDDDLVNLTARVSGPSTEDDAVLYVRCAAAQYALIRGYGFARHVRTNVGVEGGVRVADAVYTVSPSLPRGLQTIDAEVTVADCTEQGIPTV